ncbi:DNA replication protein (plasmid) [Lactobacillus brevis] [Lactiplantibacillus mudanjiangensis]|uniref:ATP-binding protein n=1 Tax=Lactiplantibacillus mudanjiangensis TaxID=1296538 RepID=UPI001015B20D|nr:DNA replication protein (plasmid) [Lactobacillus brevis] [Lactiplantibacillus mudanjiangensis]
MMLYKGRTLEQIVQANHIDTAQLPDKDELDRQTLVKAKAGLARKKMRRYYADSVWSGGLPLHFEFGDWQVSKQPNDEQAKSIGNQVFVLTKQLVHKDFNVVLSGDRGVGKTSLALAMMSYLMAQGRSAMFVSTAELLKLTNDKYDDPGIRTRLRDITRSMTEVEVLVLDDFGTEGGMKGSIKKGEIKPVHKDLQDMMYQVSNARVDFAKDTARGATIITTNNTKAQLKQMYEAKFIDRVYTDDPAHQILFAGMEGVRNV